MGYRCSIATLGSNQLHQSFAQGGNTLAQGGNTLRRLSAASTVHSTDAQKEKRPMAVDALRLPEEERFISSYTRSFALAGAFSPAATLRPRSRVDLPGTPTRSQSRPLTQGSMPRSSSETQLTKQPTPLGLNEHSVDSSWEKRRTVMEMLTSHELKGKAKAVFRGHDIDSSGLLEFNELRNVLRTLARMCDLPLPDNHTTERLLKCYDINGDHCLDFEEFFELLVSALRRTVFDRSDFQGRDFFVTKHHGRVWDSYEKIKQLGNGSFGKAYLSRKRRAHGGAREERAVKVVKKSRAKIPVEDIEREIMVMRQLDHPHIVRLFEWFEDSRSIYLVMDFLPGGTLRAVVLSLQAVSESSLKEAWIRKVTQQVLEAMAYCHRLRLIHRDLKDENIMLLGLEDGTFASEPFAVIIDMGVAEMFTLSDPNCKGIGGTPVTMAPEVWTNTFGPKCDVWSAGCILFELLAGQMPFAADSMEPSAWLRVHKRGPDWKLIRTSPASKELCSRMLRFQESERLSMAECLKEEWFNLQEHELLSVPAEQFAALEGFCQEAAVKRALMFEIASRLPIERSRKVVEVFKAFDADHSGHITLQELQAAFEALGLRDPALAERTFKVLDVDQDGSLSFTELTSGVLTLFRDLLEERLHALFLEHWDGKGEGLDSKGLSALFENAVKLRSVSGSKSAEVLKRLERTTRHSRVSFEVLRDHLLGEPRASTR